MPDYIPPDDAGKVLWMNNWATWLQTNGLTHGLTATEISQMLSLATIAGQGLTNSVTKQAEARAAVVTKNLGIGNGLDYARRQVQRVQNHPDTTDADRAAAGITIPDTDPTPTHADAVMMLPPPLIVLDFGLRRQVTIHWGPNPADEHHNARPAVTIGCQIQYARGGIPQDETQWVTLDVDTESPLLHVTNDTTPTTYAFRARYVGKKVRFGAFCDPVVCTVSV